MKFERLTPMLWTNDLQETISFYTTMLGFALDEFSEEWGWCHLHKDDTYIMFAKPNEHSTYDGQSFCTGSFYFVIDEVDELWDAIKSKAKLAYAIDNFSHNMREFGIFDNNGYMLQFGRELKEGETISTED